MRRKQCFCVDCLHHHEVREAGQIRHLCECFGFHDPVTGKSLSPRSNECHQERRSGLCGAAGVYWRKRS